MNKANVTRTRLQQHPAECGAVSLGIVLEWLGRDFSNTYLRTMCGVGRDGATIAQLQRGAYRLGFDTKITKKGINRLRQQARPLIIHWDMNHFIVLESIDEQYAYVNDPAIGRRKISLVEFRKHYTGICIEVLQSDKGSTIGADGRTSRITLFNYLSPKLISVCSRYALVLGLFALFIEVVYSGLFHGYYNYAVVNDLSHWASILGVIGIVTVLSRVIVDRVSQHIESKLSGDVEHQLFRRVLNNLSQRDISFFEGHYDGEIVNKVISLSGVSKIIGTTIFSVLESILFILVASVMILLINPPLFVVVFLPYLALLTFRFYIRYQEKENSVKVAQAHGYYQGQLMQRLSDFERFASMGLKFELFSSLLSYSSTKHQKNYSAKRSRALFDVLEMSFEAITPPLMLFASCYLLLLGEISFGAYAFTYMLSLITLPKVKKLQFKLDEYLTTKNAVEESEDFLIREGESPLNLEEIKPSDSDYLFEMVSVGFGYNGIDCSIFRGVNLAVLKNQVVCLTGESGSGKTTLLEILSGLRKPVEGASFYRGEVAFNNVDAGFVFADEIVHGTLASYFFGAESVDVERMIASLEIVELDKRLGFNALNGGMDEIAAETLSVGELQRLSLARAICRNGDVIFFDEAFSHIDLEQTKRIVERLKQRKFTLIMATQRSEIQSLSDCVYTI